MAMQNSRAFLFPMVLNRRTLADEGLELRFFTRADPGLADCDVLLIDSKALDAAAAGTSPTVLLAAWRRQVPVGYFDLTDSATQVRPELFAHVTLYFKNQLVRDRSVLRQRLYGQRTFTDYYHRAAGIEDADPSWSTPLDDRQLARLRVGWNAGLANYTPYGPRLAALYDRVAWPGFLYYPRSFHPPAAARPVDVTCRMNVRYARATVAHQRLRTVALLQPHARADRISKQQYYREMRASRVAVSPFGWGEINQKDFECFLSGTAIVKPDVSGIDTWPGWFEAGVTYASCGWDLADLNAAVEDLLQNDSRRRAIAEAAQERYRAYLSAEGQGAFRRRLADVVAELRAAGRAPAAG